jgi:hypothetical protein
MNGAQEIYPHQVPSEWLAKAGLRTFKPSRPSFRCETNHVLIALSEIEQPMRNASVTLDANGFGRDRMMNILTGIREDHCLPPIDVEKADPGQRPYRVRAGFHRYYASLAAGFSHVPAQIVDRL